MKRAGPFRFSILALAIGVVLGCLVGVGGVLVLTQSPEQASAGRAVPALPPVTAIVTLQRLVDSVEVRCEHVTKSLSATAPASSARYRKRVVTAMGVKSGDPLTSGTLVAAVSGQPVIAFLSSVPFYRNLRVGDRGVDVKALEDGLLAAGRIAHADRTLDRATANALKGIYRKAGTSSKSAFSVDSAWAVPANSRVSMVKVAVGDVVGGKEELVTAISGIGHWQCAVPAGLDVTALQALEGMLDGKRVVVRIAKATVDPESNETMLTITSGQPLPPDSALVVTVVSANTAKEVLSVPAGAIFVAAGGSTSVRVLANGVTSELQVETGVAAGGWVEVSGDGLAAGLDVVIRGSE